ncbi:MAG: hypothetical protein M3409_09665 [Gemmatimonadota bacterium]|nr:hypothetical protein [Gemmatimonadota bacterium]
MHVYLRNEPVDLEMRETDPEGLLSGEAGLVAVAFWVHGNERPSFRALLPPETLEVLTTALREPVRLGVLAEEPEEGEELRVMVGLSLPPDAAPGEEEGEGGAEPWAAANPDAWRGDEGEAEGEDRTVMLAFAPLVRLERRFPDDFGEELSDLLESALAGDTRPSLQARVDRMLGDG